MTGRWWLAAMLYLALAIYTTWPLSRSLTTSIPGGSELAATVPLFNLWTVWWNADRASRGWHGYWDAPIFHPTQGTFVFSEAQPTMAVVAPLAWWVSPALAYNVYLLTMLTLNGLFARRLLLRLGCGAWAAFVGGVLVLQLPFVIWQLGVLQLASLWPMLWTIRAAIDVSEHGGWQRAGELGLAFGLTYLSCNYYGLFLAVLLAPAGLWLIRREWWTRRWLLQLSFAASVAAALMAPVVLRQRAASREHNWTRSETTLQGLSAHWRDLFDTPWPQWIDYEPARPERKNLWPLGSGWIKLVAAVIGLGCGLCWSTSRRAALLWVSIAVIALLLAQGPTLTVWFGSPYDACRAVVPGFAQIRSPFRFVMFWQMAVALLAVLMVDALRPARWTTATVSTRWRSLLAVLSLGLGVSLIGELQPSRQTIIALPIFGPTPDWVDFLRDETPVDSAIVCLPFVQSGEVGAYAETTWWMAWSMYHRRPLLNGYSGYFPETYVTLKNEMMTFPQQPVPSLTKLGAHFAVVQRRAWTEEQIARFPASSAWTWRFSDELAGIDIYELPTANTP